MRHTLLVIISIAALCIAACSRQYDPRLIAAESAMTEHPDSALAMLNAIDRSTVTSDRDRALYALLMSQALDKNFIYVTDDSLISIAYDYYSSHDDKRRHMQSQYYLGRVSLNAADYPRSLFLFFKTMQQAKELDDPFWMGMTARNIRDTYDYTYNNIEALEYARISSENMLRTGKKPYIDWALYDLAQSLHNIAKYHESLEVSLELFKSPSISDEPHFKEDLYRLIGKSLIGTDDYSRALPFFEYLCSTPDATSSDFAFLGDIHLKNGNLQKAKSALEKVTEDDVAATSLKSKIYLYEKDYLNAYNTLEEIRQTTDQYYVNSITSKITGTVEDYYKYEQALADAELKKSRVIRYSILIIASLIIIVLSIIFYYYRRNKLVQLEHSIMITEELKKLLTDNNSKYNRAEASIKTLLSSRYETLDKLCNTYYEYHDSPKMTKHISDEIIAMIEQIASEPDKIKEIEDAINLYEPELMTNFRADFPNIKDEDYKLFMFSVLGLSINTISIFLNAPNLRSVYNRKARLKDKIQRLDETKRKQYLDFM